MPLLYTEGDRGVFERSFSDPDTGTPVDPATIVFYAWAPSVDPVAYTFGVDPEFVQVEAGTYRISVDLDRGGLWRFRWESSGTYASADQFSRWVEPRNVEAVSSG